MSLTYITPLVFPALAHHTATVIFFHGLGDTRDGWSFAVENWRRRQRLNEVKFILPQAPNIPITVNGGARMPGWYDIASMSADPEALRRNEDKDGILRTQQHVFGLIQKEIDSGIPADRIVLGGFSQGGAVSIFSGLTAKVKLAGVVGLSAYLLLSNQFTTYLPTPNVNKETPIFMGHGDSDMVVNTIIGKKTYDVLKDLGYNVDFKLYPNLEHSASPEEILDVESFLIKVLPTKGKEEL